MAYEDALKFFRDNEKLANIEERPIEYNFITGMVVLVEELAKDMRDIKSELQNLQIRMRVLESK